MKKNSEKIYVFQHSPHGEKEKFNIFYPEYLFDITIIHGTLRTFS